MVEAKLQEVLRSAPAQKGAATTALLTNATAPDLIAMISILASEQTSIQDAKPILEAMAKEKVPKLKNDDTIAVCNATMERRNQDNLHYIC